MCGWGGNVSEDTGNWRWISQSKTTHVYKNATIEPSALWRHPCLLSHIKLWERGKEKKEEKRGGGKGRRGERRIQEREDRMGGEERRGEEGRGGKRRGGERVRLFLATSCCLFVLTSTQSWVYIGFCHARGWDSLFVLFSECNTFLRFLFVLGDLSELVKSLLGKFWSSIRY